MAISTLDHVVAGFKAPIQFGKALTGTMVAGTPRSLWAVAGNPGPGGYDTTLAGVNLVNPVAGQIPFTDPAAAAYLARLWGQGTIAGQLILADRIWHNGGFTITSTAAQTINSAAFPARDGAGSANGDGILLGLEVSAAAGAAAPTITVGYTNEAGTAGRTATNYVATANSPAAGTFYPIGLQAGDKGVRSVQSLTLSASWVSGTINLVAYRQLATLNLAGAYVPDDLNALTGGLVQMYSGSVPFLIFVPSTTTSSQFMGGLVYDHG